MCCSSGLASQPSGLQLAFARELQRKPQAAMSSIAVLFERLEWAQSDEKVVYVSFTILGMLLLHHTCVYSLTS